MALSLTLRNKVVSTWEDEAADEGRVKQPLWVPLCSERRCWKLTAALVVFEKQSEWTQQGNMMSKLAGLAGCFVATTKKPLAVCREGNRARQPRTQTHTRARTWSGIKAPSRLVSLPGPVCFIMCSERKQQTARLPTPPTLTNTHVDSGGPETHRPTSTSGRLQPPGNYTLTAANVTLVNGDAAAVSITVNQGVLSPASLVWTHAATSNHFPHAAPIRRNVFPLPVTAQTSPRPVKWSSRTLSPCRA